MNEHKTIQIVAAPGHEEYVKELMEKQLKKAGLTIAICPTGHEAFFEELKTPAVPQLQNRETWRGKGKRRMPRGK
ncbi:MAG: hypothetical protein COB09_08365 [Thalassobium sp.]|nr:MAG: hypothetical protein COB09_08365 [Thalassobium sp.]